MIEPGDHEKDARSGTATPDLIEKAIRDTLPDELDGVISDWCLVVELTMQDNQNAVALLGNSLPGKPWRSEGLLRAGIRQVHIRPGDDLR